MMDRCHNISSTNSKNYGKRGISLCEEWRADFNSFYSWAIASGWKQGLQIDRIDNDGNYEPKNCRWVTAKENTNNKRNNHRITIDGVSKTITQWAEENNITPTVIWHRIKELGWSAKEAVFSKVQFSKRGEKYNRSKLTIKDVVEIYTSRLPANTLSDRFNLSRASIYDIWERKTWNEVTKKLRRQ